MRFFIMKQDIQLPYCMKLRDFDLTRGTHIFLKEDKEKLNDSAVLYLSGNGDEAKPDFIQHPVYMISDKIKEIIDSYEDDLILQNVIMIHKESQKQYRYYQILMDQVEAQSERMEYYPDGLEKKIILDKEKIAQHHIFLLKNSGMKHPLVSLALMESLLRRNVSGVIFEEAEVV